MPTAVDTNGWDAHPRLLDYQGRLIEFFTRGALAKALNRQVVSIRALEQRGVLCPPRVRSRNSRSGHWLYTRDQIEDLIKLTTEEGLMDPQVRRPFSETFVKRAHEILRRLPS